MMPTPRPKLRKREIALAVGVGALAAGGAALILAEGDSHAPMMVAAAPQTYELESFDEISTVGPQDVVITRGDASQVRSEGSPEALGLLEVVVDDGELIIRPKEDYGFGFDWDRLSSAKFHVTVPRLEQISVAGSGDVTVDQVESEDFAANLAGAATLSIAALAVEEAEFRIGGSGNVVAAGTAREANISIGGSGEVQAAGLTVQTADVSIAGSGDVALTVQQEAEVSIMGSGDVDISGPARCSVSRMGSGNGRCSGGGGDGA